MSSSRFFIKDLKAKDEVNEVFNIKYLNLMTGKDSKKYLNIIFADSTGDIEGRVWHNAEQVVKKIERGSYVKVQGRVNSYQGRRQLIVKNMDEVNSGDINEEDFLKKSDHDAEKMFSELFDIVESLSDFYIKKLLLLVLSDPEIARRFKTWQAGKTIHHAYQSGLLEHVLSCTQLAKTLSKHYELDENYVVAGTVLHDMCKIYELSNGVNVDYTEEGKLVGHLVKGVELVDRFCDKIDDFPFQTKIHLKHILVSHHGEYAYGSPKLPSTREAALVHYIDHMDSKIGSFNTVIKSDTTPGHWSNYVRHLDRMVFKGELPHYSQQMISEETSEGAPVKNTKEGKELKQNLGDLLQGFKIDE